MANVIRHKRGTSNPAAGDFSQTAELLVNTSDGGLFTKTDGGSVVEVGANASNLSTGTVPSGRLSGSYGISVTGSSASCTGNAASATVLQTARTIGGVSFNGSANINLPGVNTAGNQNTSGSSASCTGNAASATVLQTARLIGGVSFNGSANINLPGVNTTGNQNTSGNAASATVLQTARTIGGVSFNGSANINLPGVNTTGNQNTSGNAATATQLATPRTIGLGGDLSGSASFDGSSNITISAAVADDSHNHVVSNIDGLQTTLDSKANLSGATFTGDVQVNARLDVGTGSGSDHEIRIYKADNNVSDHIQFYNGTTRMSEIGCHDTTWLRINQETSKNIYTPRYIRADAGFFVDGTSKGIDGSGNFIGGTIAGASDYGTLLRSDANDTATGILTFNAACRGQVDALTSASTITPNFANSNNFSISLSTNTTIANPSNLVAGQSGAIAITYNGGYTVAFGSYWKFAGGTAPTATSTSGKVDVLVYYVESSTRISAQLLLNMGG